MFIFLSYGHDQFKPFAIRLKQDLELHGHEVWFDENQLPGGVDWEHYIEKGLITTMHKRGKLLLLMTQYSMREPDGFCLNEIAYAESHRTPVIPVMVETIPPPERYKNYIDMVDSWQPDTNPSGYEAGLNQIIKAITNS